MLRVNQSYDAILAEIGNLEVHLSRLLLQKKVLEVILNNPEKALDENLFHQADRTFAARKDVGSILRHYLGWDVENIPCLSLAESIEPCSNRAGIVTDTPRPILERSYKPLVSRTTSEEVMAPTYTEVERYKSDLEQLIDDLDMEVTRILLKLKLLPEMPPDFHKNLLQAMNACQIYTAVKSS